MKSQYFRKALKNNNITVFDPNYLITISRKIEDVPMQSAGKTNFDTLSM